MFGGRVCRQRKKGDYMTWRDPSVNVGSLGLVLFGQWVVEIWGEQFPHLKEACPMLMSSWAQGKQTRPLSIPESVSLSVMTPYARCETETCKGCLGGPTKERSCLSQAKIQYIYQPNIRMK